MSFGCVEIRAMPNLSRAFVEPLVRDWKRETLEFDTALVTTELVTNAVLHTQSAHRAGHPTLRQGCPHRGDRHTPFRAPPHGAPRAHSSSALTLGQSGRGLQVVSEPASRAGAWTQPRAPRRCGQS